MVIRYNGEEPGMPTDSPGRAKAHEVLLNYSRLEYPPFDGLAKRLDSFIMDDDEAGAKLSSVTPWPCLSVSPTGRAPGAL
jgi:hypothetical protein